jgi:hypothetical protein
MDASQYQEEANAFLLADRLSPETCGPVLVGLQGSEAARGLVPMATLWAEQTTSSLTRAWIQLGLRVNNVDATESPEAALPLNLSIVALEALAARGGNHHLLRTEAA